MKKLFFMPVVLLFFCYVSNGQTTTTKQCTTNEVKTPLVTYSKETCKTKTTTETTQCLTVGGTYKGYGGTHKTCTTTSTPKSNNSSNNNSKPKINYCPAKRK